MKKLILFMGINLAMILVIGLLDPTPAKANPLFQGPFEIPAAAPRKPALVYLPNQYEEKAEWPLVVLLHGFTGSAEAEDLYLGMRFRVSARGFILVTPNGTADSNGNQFWNATDVCCDFFHSNVNDVKYLTNLVSEIQARYHVDAKRIYLFGHSNGGFMANRLTCETENLFAAAASLAGGTYRNAADCRLKQPLPYLQIHAQDDPTISYNDNPVYAGGFATVDQWIERNGCRNRPKIGDQLDLVLAIPGHDTTPLIWQENCSQNAGVSLWSIAAFEANYHSPHVPIFNWNAMEKAIDFFFAHQRN